MELEMINRLYLELSQIATAKTARELELEDLLTSARAIAERKGDRTAWARYSERLAKAGIGCVTAKTFRVLPSDSESDLSDHPRVSDSEKAIKERVLEDAVNNLREHFPHVQILATWEDDDTKNTYDMFRGKGNWYARMGMAREFLVRDKSHTQAHEIGNALHPEDED